MTDKFIQLEQLFQSCQINHAQYMWLRGELYLKQKLEAIARMEADATELEQRMVELMPISEAWKHKERDLEITKEIIANFRRITRSDRPH